MDENVNPEPAADNGQEGASDQHAVSGTAVENAGGAVVYTTFYCLSYGVVFSARLLADLVPQGDKAWNGMAAGAAAAIPSADHTSERLGKSTAATRKKVGDSCASVAQFVQEKVESVQDRFAEQRQPKGSAIPEV